MTSEQQYLLQVIRDYLHGCSSERNNVDWSMLSSLARSQQIDSIVYKQCKAFLPLNSTLRLGYLSALTTYEERISQCRQIDALLVDIPHIWFKGVLLANLYADPQLRTMGDIDLLIHVEDRDKAHKLLLEAGYEPVKIELDYDEWIYSKNCISLELHTGIAHPDLGKEKYVEYFSHIWDYVQDGMLSWDEHFVLVIQHLHTHFIANGVGIRPFIDIAVMIQRLTLNWVWILEELQKIDLAGFCRVVLGFIEQWFGVKTPIAERIESVFYEQATERIFRDGLFGHENIEENEDNWIPRLMSNTNMNFKQARWKLFVQRMFPSYQELAEYPYCAYLNKSKALLPVAWVHRALKRGFNKKSREEFINRNWVSEDRVKGRVEYLKNWGL